MLRLTSTSTFTYEYILCINENVRILKILLMIRTFVREDEFLVCIFFLLINALVQYIVFIHTSTI